MSCQTKVYIVMGKRGRGTRKENESSRSGPACKGKGGNKDSDAEVHYDRCENLSWALGVSERNVGTAQTFSDREREVRLF